MNDQKLIFLVHSNPHLFHIFPHYFVKTDFFHFLHFALQYVNMSIMEYGKDQNVPLPEIGSLAKNPIFCWGHLSFVNGAHLLPYAWQPFYPLDPSLYLFSFLSQSHFSAGVCFFSWKFYLTVGLCQSLCASELYAERAGWKG